MKQFKLVFSVIILIASIFLLFNKLFSPQPIQVVLETGQEITTQNPNYYALPEVLLLVAASFLIGTTAIYLFYNSERLYAFTKKLVPDERTVQKEYMTVLNLLKGDEKRIFSELKDNRGEMLQNKLVEKTGLSKVSVTRALMKLEHKNLVLKERCGLTNKIKLKL